MNGKTQIAEFIDKLIEEGETVLSTKWIQSGNWISASGPPQYVDLEQFKKWSASCKLLISLMGDLGNPWKEHFDGNCNNGLGIAQGIQGTLKAIREAIANDLVKFEDLKVSQQNQEKAVIEKSEVFIVHGRDDLAKVETARFIEKMGFNAIILHEQANSGKTIIEKIEEHTNVGFAIVLYTPCDIGSLAGESSQTSRARQNVVFEHGYLIGKLGRQNVCALVKGDVEIPTDISGIVYITLDNHNAWHLAIAKELRNADYVIDMNKVI